MVLVDAGAHGGDRRPAWDEQAVREALAAQRSEALTRIDALSGSFRDMVGAALSANADDEHDPEGATIAYERAQLNALLDQAHAHLSEVDHALERLDSDAFGACERCGQPIAAARLTARPTARTCVGCVPPRRR